MNNQILSDLSKNEIYGTPKNELSVVSKTTEELGSGNKHFSIEEPVINEKYEVGKETINEKVGETDSTEKKSEKIDEKSEDFEVKEEEKEDKKKNVIKIKSF